MDKRRWNLIDELFEAVVDLPPGERAALLEERCGADQELARDVASLLRAHDQAAGFMTGSASEAAAGLISEGTRSDEMPRRVGPYRLLAEIARGGMGAVYEAERDDGEFRHRVAIKILQPGRQTEGFRLRFLSERQILASLKHDNIARLYDGGVLQDGRPYFIMEYVDGSPIDEYCGDKDLDLRERLELIRDVADAVRFAHHNFVVHRDLKPSNILVTPEGKVKLLDFGIAKVLEAGVTADLAATQTGTRWMTPEYAAPEQILGRPATTATDVYQLGVIAYRLLTDVGPFSSDGKSVFELERAVCEDDPPRPSTAVRRDDVTLSPERKRRRSRDLAGDIDAIVMKALRKEPEERYSSAGDLASDIRRYLDGLPVLARQGSSGYRLHKFMRRNRLRIAILATTGVLLLATGVAYTIQITRAGAAAERAAEEAALERAKAERVATFLTDLFEAGDLEKSQGDTLTVFDLVDRGVRELDELSEQPAVQAQLALVIGRVYHRLGQFEKAERLLERAAGILRAVPLTESEELPLVLEALFELDVSRGEFRAAEDHAREAVEVATAIHGGHHPVVAQMTNRLGQALFYQGDSTAVDFYRRALEIFRSESNRDSSGMGVLMVNIALIEQQNGRLEEAERLLRESLSMFRAKGGDEDRVADATRNLAILLGDRGRLDEAEELHRQHVAMRRAIDGDTSVSVASALSFLGTLYDKRGDFEHSIDVNSEALAILMQLFGPRHQYAAMAMNNLAYPLRMTGRYDEAEAQLKRSLDIRRELYGASHYRVATVLRQLGNILSDQGDDARALFLFEEALQIRREHFGESDKNTANSLNDVAGALENLGRTDEAEEVLRRARRIWAEVGDPDDGRSRTAFLLGRVLLGRAAIVESEALLRQAWMDRRQRFGTDHWLTAASASLLSECLIARSRVEEAETLLKGAHDALAERPGVAAELERRKTLERLIGLYESTGRPELARPLREELREP